MVGKRLGRKALAEVACVAKPDTILSWYRSLIARKFDGSKHRTYPGRPRVSTDIAQLVIQFARENPTWGYGRIAGAVANLGHVVSRQTVANIVRAHGLAPAPKRRDSTSWKDFIRAHMAVLGGLDFFTVEVLTWKGLVTYYVLFLIELETRRVTIAGITAHPNAPWMQTVAGTITARGCRYVLHDRDTKFCDSFRSELRAHATEPLRLPPRSPNLNAFAERWVRSVKEECLSKLILFGEGSLHRALTEFVAHYHHERNHQGKGNVLLFPRAAIPARANKKVRCEQRLGGLLKYYSRAA
jgi:putative transposase